MQKRKRIIQYRKQYSYNEYYKQGEGAYVKKEKRYVIIIVIIMAEYVGSDIFYR